MIFKNNRGISPVVTTALLLVVAVSAVVGFSGWFNEFSSNLFVDVESDSSSSSSVRVEGVFNDVLYLKSSSDVVLSSLLVYSSNGSLACKYSTAFEVFDEDLIAHWDFSNNGDGIIHDLSGNGNDGKLYGDTRLLLDFDDNGITDRTSYNSSFINHGATLTNLDCVSGSCYEFKSSTDRIEMLNSTFLNFSEDSFSISFWIKPYIKSLGNTQTFIVKGNDWTNGPNINPGFGLGYRSNSDIIYIVLADGTRKIGASLIKNLHDGEFHFVSFVVDRENDTLSLIVDEDISTNNISTLGLINNNLPLFLSQYGQHYLNGSIDEVGIYSKALSPLEIKELYNSQKAGFVEFSDEGMEFDGIDDYVKIQKFPVNSNITIFASSKRNNLDNSGNTILALNENDLILGYWFKKPHTRLNDSTLYGVELDNNEKKTISVTVEDNYSNRILKLYDNGFLINSSSISDNNPGDNLFYSIGMELDYTNPSDFFEGYIYEIKIYNRTLKDYEIILLSDLGFNLSLNLNKINFKKCNLNKGKKYNILGFTNLGDKIDVEVIPQ